MLSQSFSAAMPCTSSMLRCGWPISKLQNRKPKVALQDFGTIQSCAVLYDHAGKSKQVGFCQFTSDAEANAAVAEMHSKVRHPYFL